MLDILITILGILVIIMMWVMLYDSNRFVVQQYSVRDERIKKNCRAVVLSDLHNKKYGRNNEKLLAAIREQKPDFILVAGDILTARPKESFEPAIQLLTELKKEYPIYYGNGNHEHRLKLYPEVYGEMGEKYGEALDEIGVEPLVNSHIQIPEVGICVYGAEIHRDYYKRFRKTPMEKGYMRELLGKPESGQYTVLLAHNPDYFPEYAAWGADLTLSGHVHGGVVRVPLWGKGVIAPSLRLFPEYDGGIFEKDGAIMLLSRGLGTHTIPVRLFNPGELWVLDFCK